MTGMSGGGKSTFTQGLTERLGRKSIQFCILDPEGDYEGLEDAVGIGRPDRPPHLQEITDLLRKAETDVVVNLLGVRLEDRPQFVAQVLPELTSLRAVLGRPHVVIVDEAHHMLPFQSITQGRSRCRKGWRGSCLSPPSLKRFRRGC